MSTEDAEQVVGKTGADQRGGASRERVDQRGGRQEPQLPQLNVLMVRIPLLIQSSTRSSTSLRSYQNKADRIDDMDL